MKTGCFHLLLLLAALLTAPARGRGQPPYRLAIESPSKLHWVIGVYEGRSGRQIWSRTSHYSTIQQQWSADGRALSIFIVQENDRNRLLVWRAGERVRDWNGADFLAGEPLYKMAWSPDKNSLLLHIPGAQGNYDTHTGALWRLNLTTGRAGFIGDAVTDARWDGPHRVRYTYRDWGHTGQQSGYRQSHAATKVIR